ncbi:MAG TPA: TRAP transporter large permease [Thermodesulfobacteriota bacterium]|nr:TRAP transporter large permease [Thermodesulfobacteriota bacterium]
MGTVFILLGAFGVLLAINVPVAFSMVLACILSLLWQGSIPISTVTLKLYSGIDTFPFLAIPLFILAGGFMEQGGISQRLVQFARNLVGHIKGGLGFVVVVSEIFFSGISGSSIADASAIGSLLLPSMKQAGYEPSRAAAIVAAATGMGMMIPPCLNMVVLGAMANISIAGLFMGGFLPGFLMAATLMVIIYYQSSRGLLPGAEGKRAPLGAILKSLRDTIVPLMMPVIIFGGIFSGIFTATEAASVATVYAFIISVFIYREIKWRDIEKILVETAVLTGVVCLLVGAATGFSWILATHQVPQALGGFIGSVSEGRVVFLLLTIAVFFFFGMILDGLPAILIFFPILYPIAQSLGIHPLHFGVLVIAVVGISIVAPPIGLCLVIICSLAKIKLTDTIRPLIPYTMILVADLVVIAFWPWLILFLPALFKI